MGSVGIRALKQNASEVVSRVAAGEVLTVTDRGRPVAILSGWQGSNVERLVARGARKPLKNIKDLPAPTLPAGLSAELYTMRDEDRY